MGKTTTARIIARALNCERVDPQQGQVNPCGQCNSCRAILNETHADVREMDAEESGEKHPEPATVEQRQELNETGEYEPSDSGELPVREDLQAFLDAVGQDLPEFTDGQTDSLVQIPRRHEFPSAMMIPEASALPRLEIDLECQGRQPAKSNPLFSPVSPFYTQTELVQQMASQSFWGSPKPRSRHGRLSRRPRSRRPHGCSPRPRFKVSATSWLA